MINDQNNLNRPNPLESLDIIASTLSVRCSGTEIESMVQQDLNLPQGKSIAELLYDQKEEERK